MQIINGILSDFGLKDILIDLVNIYIDIIHLGGDYEVAVNTCSQYLNQYTDDEIMADEQLIKMRIRKIHHSMFFVPVDELLREAEHIVGDVNIKEFPEQYNELLFLLGGNLGVLAGDLDYCTEWLEISMAYARKHEMDAFVHRTVRKQADILLAKNEYDAALTLIEGTITVDTPIEQVDTRYKIYLMGVLGEVYRKQGNLEKAYHCYDIVEKKSLENHMMGWQAHSYLAKGMVELQSGKNDEAYEHLNDALDIYKRIKQYWGIINAETAMILYNLKRGNNLIESFTRECLKEAERMHYTYNVDYLKKLLDGEISYLQLFFL
jgi:tetratricopeptide (TPR) repeat protein